MRELPGLFDVRLKARSIAYLFATGATLGLLTLAFPHADEVRDVALIVLALSAYVIATLVSGSTPTGCASGTSTRSWLPARSSSAWRTTTRGRPRSTRCSTCGRRCTRSTSSRWREAFAQLAFVAVSYAVVLAVQDTDSVIVRWLLAVGTPTVAGILIARLLGRLRQHARSLEESEERTRQVLDTAPDAFVTLDRDGVITTWNEAAERMFGWTKAEALGQMLRDLVTPEELRGRHDERRWALVESESPDAMQRFDVELVRRDGRRFPGEATVARVEIQGEVFVSGFIVDVTERLRQRAEREALFREQAARAEAERVTEIVAGMQALVDATLAHRSLEGILRELVTQVRGVLGADHAAIALSDESGAMAIARLGARGDGRRAVRAAGRGGA